ncbi:MAG: dienelactone hydrolase family protein [Acidobacteriota bacterium]
MSNMENNTSMVSIPARDGGQFQAFLALPVTGRGPGLVLIQEIFGVNQYMRDVAGWYARRGFIVVCPDLFWREEPGVELTDRTDEEWQKAFGFMQGMDVALAVDDCAAALEFLRAHPACSDKVGAIGFCLGGQLAYLLAARHRPDCAVGYYGVNIDRSLEESSLIRSPLMLHMAGKDEYCGPEARADIHGKLDAHPQVTIHDYPEQDHAFARPAGKHFDAAAAELADLRSLEFLVRHLASPGPVLSNLWEEHVKYEFETRDVEATLETMVEDAYVNHIPVLTCGVGREQLRRFYAERFIPQMPPDTRMTPVSRTIGPDRVVDEMIFEFTHTMEMDWMLPGVPPTGKKVSVPLVAIVHFRDGKLAHEHIYWDQASALVQLDLLDTRSLPIVGAESARKVLDPNAEPSNALIQRADERKG